MNALLLRNYMRRAASLQSFKEYRASELQAGAAAASVTSDGTLLEFETLELRLHPPNVVIDNDSYDDMTVITIDSANRPGTLIEVVQCLTELNLSIRKARISSDGGWFVDEFFVTETPKGKVVHQHKLDTIRKVLSVGSDPSLNVHSDFSAVFELSGRDQKGLLAAVLSTLAAHHVEVQSVAVWTYHNQVALVVGVVDRQAPHMQHSAAMMLQGARHSHSTAMMGGPPTNGALPMHAGGRGHLGPNSLSMNGGAGAGLEPDPAKMQGLAQVLVNMLGGEGQAHVSWEVVQGDIHHERRLHHLLLQEEERSWESQQGMLSGAPSLGSHASLSGATALLVNTAITALQPQQQVSGRISSGGAGGPPPGSPHASTPPPMSPNRSQASAAAATVALFGSALPADGQQAAGMAPLDTRPGNSSSADGSSSMPSQPQPQPAMTRDGAAAATPAESSFASLQQQQQLLQQQQGQLVAGGDEAAHGWDASGKQRPLQPTVSGLSTFPSGGYVPAPTAMQSNDLANSVQGGLEAASARADVRIQHSPLLKYYLVTITCKDRNKLFFDTVCTLADMQYDVYHGAIDSENDQASQLFYVRPRSGELVLDEVRVRQLAYMLECAVQRRFPRGLRMHMQTTERNSAGSICSALSAAGFCITRAEMRMLPDGRGFLDLTMTDSGGQVPSALTVARACEAAGGMAADELHPLMAVAGVGGAAAAAATGLARAGMYTHLHHTAAAGVMGQAGVAGGGLPPSGPARLQHPLPPHLVPQGPTSVVARASAKFQFAISASHDRRSRGPLGHAASAAALAGGNLL